MTMKLQKLEKILQAELDEFDASDHISKVKIYKLLGKANFINLYGSSRIPFVDGQIDPDLLSHEDVQFGASPIPPDAQKLSKSSKPKLGVGIYKDGNPKTQFGAVKPGTYYTPPYPLYEYSLAHMQGALKYGHYNWRNDPVSISTYIDAAKRHIDLYVAGQKNASDTGIHNLAHAMCCMSIIMDAELHNTLNDDRHMMIQYTNNATGEILEGYMEVTKDRVTRIKEEWSGHAEAVKDGPDAFKAWKAQRDAQMHKKGENK